MTFFSLEIPAVAVILGALALGTFFCFFGYRLFKVALGALGFCAGALGGGGLASLFADGSNAILIVATILGGIAGSIILVWAYYVGMFFVGACGGLLLGGLIGSNFSGTIEVIIIVVLALVGGVLALKVQRIFLCFSTALLGASLIVLAGLHAILGSNGAQNVMTQFSEGGSWGTGGWLAMASFLLLVVVGLGAQLTANRKKRS